MTVTSGKPPAGTGLPPVHGSSAPDGRPPDAVEDGAGRAGGLPQRVAAGTDGAGPAAQGTGDEGVTAAKRMENVVLPGARRSDRFHLRNDNRIR